MNALADAVDEYLRLRRSLGYKLEDHGRLLHSFTGYLDSLGVDHVTIEAAVAWATLPQGAEPVWWYQRLGTVRGFAVYQATIDPRTEIPPKGLLVRPTARRTPYLFSTAEIVSIMEAAARLRYPLKAATYETLIGLLACSGMRVGEAIRLDRRDVDLDGGVITAWRGKFGKSRRLPLHETTTQALVSYADSRDQLCRHPKADSFFVSLRGTRLDHSVVDAVFRSLIQSTGIGRATTSHPHAHDLRHSFAVETLTDWHRYGSDVGARLPALSTYMGHVSPSSTYWYLHSTPELLALAAQRLEGPQ
jgi:integrase/recombinase XerD